MRTFELEGVVDFLLLSDGDPGALIQSARPALIDWRDLKVAAISRRER